MGRTDWNLTWNNSEWGVTVEKQTVRVAMRHTVNSGNGSLRVIQQACPRRFLTLITFHSAGASQLCSHRKFANDCNCLDGTLFVGTVNCTSTITRPWHKGLFFLPVLPRCFKLRNSFWTYKTENGSDLDLAKGPRLVELYHPYTKSSLSFYRIKPLLAAVVTSVHSAPKTLCYYQTAVFLILQYNVCVCVCLSVLHVHPEEEIRPSGTRPQLAVTYHAGAGSQLFLIAKTFLQPIVST